MEKLEQMLQNKMPKAVGVALPDGASPPGDAVWHAGGGPVRLAEEHRVPALHSEQQADHLVLAGKCFYFPRIVLGMVPSETAV